MQSPTSVFITLCAILVLSSVLAHWHAGSVHAEQVNKVNDDKPVERDDGIIDIDNAKPMVFDHTKEHNDANMYVKYLHKHSKNVIFKAFDVSNAPYYVDDLIILDGLAMTYIELKAPDEIEALAGAEPMTNSDDFVVWMEGNLQSAGNGVGAKGKGGEDIKVPHWAAKVRKKAISIDLVLDEVSEDQEDDKTNTLKKVIVRRFDGNDAPRKKITLTAESDNAADEVVLTVSDSGGNIKVFDGAGNDANEIDFDGTDNIFDVGDLPKDLYVQGHAASKNVNDIEIRLGLVGGSDIDSDVVQLTVLWVTIENRHSGKMSKDNSSREDFMQVITPPSDDLGNVLLAVPTRGSLSEFVGHIAPADYAPSGFEPTVTPLNMKRRIVSGKTWAGPPDSLVAINKPPGDDTSPAAIVDSDPTSGGSVGKIYDLDAPSHMLDPRGPEDPEIHSYRRINFEAYATFGSAEFNQEVRCSKYSPWFHRQAIKNTGKLATGVTSEVTKNSFEDDLLDNPWAINEWADGTYKLVIVEGTDKGGSVKSNTADTVIFHHSWPNDLEDILVYRLTSKDVGQAINDVPGDNRNGDGTTPLTVALD